MGTLSDYQANGDNKSLKVGTTARSLGAKSIPTTQDAIPKGSIINQFTTKVSDTTKQAFGLTENAVKASAHYVANTPKYLKEDVMPFLQGIARTVTGDLTGDLHNIKTQSDQLDQQSQTYAQLYKSGKMSKENYTKALNQIADQYQQLSKDSQTVASKADRGNVVESAAMTAGDILSFGDLNLATVAGKDVAEAGGKQAINVLLDEGASNLEKIAMKVPNVRSLLMRNLEAGGKIAASESLLGYLAREGRHLAFNLLVKRPVFYQSNIGLAKDTLNHVMEGNYSQAAKSAAWIGIQALEGGPLGAASKGFSWLKNLSGKLAYGKGSFIDELSARIGDGNRTQIADYINKAHKTFPEGQGKQFEEAFRISQETSKRVFGQDINAAVDNFLTSYEGQDLSKVAPAQIVKDLVNHRQADTIIQDEAAKLVKAGKMTEDQAKRLVPVRWTALTRDGAATAIEKAGLGINAQLDAWQSYAEAHGLDNNKNLMQRVEYEINANAGTSGDIRNTILGIDAAQTIPQGSNDALRNKLAKLGYVMAEPVGGRNVNYLDVSETPKLISSAAKDNIDLFDKDVAPQPQVEAISNFLNKAGLSPEASSKEGQKKLAEAVTARLDNTGIGPDINRLAKGGDKVSGGQAILTKLQAYVENKQASRAGEILSLGTAQGHAAISDLRQLTKKEVIEALSGDGFKLTRKDAGDILKAINQGYIDVPMELRGLGDKAVDYLYKYNPLQKGYSRIQSALRYAYNPFFRAQEATETRLLSRISSNNLIWNKSRAELNDAAKLLDESGIFSSSLYGEGAQDQVLGRITANITQGQKRDLAGLALDIANKQGISLEKMIADHPDQIDDALRVIVQYPTKGILASPLARTLNYAFFPIRYNTKVTMVAAQALAKQPPTIQKAVLHSLFQFSDWLKSDEGIKWQQQYADALGVLNWITPINSIEYTLNLLNGGLKNAVNSPSNLGILGGLPIGIISQILDSQGLINLNTPYVNPKTGDVIPKYIPETTKARAATAVSDVLGSMFTYPGRTLGLPGKQENIHRLVRNFIDTNSEDYQINDETDRLTPLEQNMVRVLKGDTSKEAIDALYSAPAPGQFNGYTLPPANVNGLMLPKRRTGLPAKGKKKKTTAIPITRP
jgi:hypothetical protein